MRAIRLKYLFLIAFVAACTAPEFKTLENVTLTCASDDECPEDYFCENRLDPPECRLIENRDTTLPSLTESALSTAKAKAPQTWC